MRVLAVIFTLILIVIISLIAGCSNEDMTVTVVVKNESGAEIKRVDVCIYNECYPADHLDAGNEFKFNYKVQDDAGYHLTWTTGGNSFSKDVGYVTRGLNVCDELTIVSESVLYSPAAMSVCEK